MPMNSNLTLTDGVAGPLFCVAVCWDRGVSTRREQSTPERTTNACAVLLDLICVLVLCCVRFFFARLKKTCTGCSILCACVIFCRLRYSRVCSSTTTTTTTENTYPAVVVPHQRRRHCPQASSPKLRYPSHAMAPAPLEKIHVPLVGSTLRFAKKTTENEKESRWTRRLV